MKVIAIIGQKGGTGKTTLATGLAVAAERSGFASAILDLDPQTNAANWKDRRTGGGIETGPAVSSIQPGRLRQNIKTLEEAGADYVFIDTPGRSDTAAVEAARVADLVVIPCHPQIFDLETLSAVRDALRIAGSPKAFVLLNCIHPSATRSPVEQREVISNAFGLPVLEHHLSLLNIYAEAPATGKAPHEIEPKGRAAAELDAVFAFIDRSAMPGARMEVAMEARP